MRGNILEQQHDARWRDDHNREMSLVLEFERVGYSSDQSRLMAEHHRTGRPTLLNHNGGPLLDYAP